MSEDPSSGGNGLLERLRSVRPGIIIQRLVVVLLVTFVLIALVRPELVVGIRTEAIGLYVDSMEGRTTGEEGSLWIEQGDVEYLNRIYTERDDEVGYCGLIDQHGKMRPWLADFSGATASSIELSATNCPIGRYDRFAVLHTHPNGDPRVTAVDRQTLEVPDIDYLCIQHGRITTNIGERTDRLRCYTRVGDGSIAAVEIRVIAA